MLFWYFSIRWNSTLPAIGKVFFLSSEEYCSDYRKSTLPITGKRIIQFPVCRFLRLSVCKGNGYDGIRLIKS